MKKLTNHTAKALVAIHGIAFTVFYIIEKLLAEFFYPWMQQTLGKTWYVIITIVVAPFLYKFLAMIVQWVYDKRMVAKNKKLDISGTWYHVHIPHYMGSVDYSLGRLSVGTTTVSREFNDFTFAGDNRRCYWQDGKIVLGEENGTHWYTKASKLSDENDFDLIEIYEAKTRGTPMLTADKCPCCHTAFDKPIQIAEAENYRHGIHKLNIVTEGGKTYLKGEYSDCWPSLKTGELYFFRTEEERDAVIADYFVKASKN